jgi:hypothetical protein
MNQVSAIILFLFSPILSLLAGLLTLPSNTARLSIFLSCGWLGLAFRIPRNTFSDCLRYEQWLVEMHGKSLSLKSLTSSFYTEGTRFWDIYQPLLTFAVSRFTDDANILFMFFGLVIGVFYGGIIHEVARLLPERWHALEIVLLVSLAFTVNVASAINNVRMYTAMFVFAYGAITYWARNHRISIIYAICSPLIHFSFLIPVALLLFSNRLRVVTNVLYLIFVLSFFFAAIDPGILAGLLEKASFGLFKRVSPYLSEKSLFEENALLITANLWMQRVLILCVVTISFFSQSKTTFLNRATQFALLLMITINLLGKINQIDRFLSLTTIVGISIIAGSLSDSIRNSPQLRLMWACSLSLLVVNTALNFRLLLGFTDERFLLANPLIIWFYDLPRYNLYDYVR